MITVRKAEDRGVADHGWLKSFHTFSFADYYDPAHMGVGNLRVINDDRIAPGTGFGTHGHRDMEIVSYVLEGELAHRDSMGNGTAIRPGEVQRMTAGTGVRHSEFNHAQGQTTHFLQIWLLPAGAGLAPGYEQKEFGAADKRGRLRLVAAPDGRDGAVTLHADASIRAGLFDGDESAELALDPKRLAYVHVAEGEVTLNGTHRLAAGDGATLDGEGLLTLSRGRGADVLVFDLARV
ncbi:pirin family protein [Ideonella sp.]|uniref:pirin family protein n=1 Tax=Ideonella sp. TaxID=1929293 RepID=UPI002B47BFD3|nr:pirin family protein [Ideonella sp.]HJV69696.1 pirin family protein [Ideonella sp.]HSN31183.1 pirin family protein [Ideonella sp.]